MPSYTLNIDINPADLPTIYQAEELVTLMKQVSNGTPLAWITFKPFQNNTVEWIDNYALYASSTQVQDDAVIQKLSDVDAAPQVDYKFADGTFSSPAHDSNLQQGQYKIINGMPSPPASLTFGLAQSVQVNGTANPNKPINAVTVPTNQSAVFTPFEKVSVFLHATIKDSMVVTNVDSKQIVLTFGGDVTQITVKYDPTIGQFVQQ